MSASTDHSGGSVGPASSGDGAPGYDSSANEDEVSLLDILLVLARRKTIILRTVLAFVLLGVGYALLAPEEYTSGAQVVREQPESSSGASLPGGLSSLRGLGINLGGAASGLGPAAYPSVLESREVRLSVVRDTFSFPDAERPMTFIEYVNRPPSTFDLVLKYTVRVPWTIKNGLADLVAGSSEDETRNSDTESSDLTWEEHRAIMEIGDMVSSSVNPDDGLMNISVTANGSEIANDLASSFVKHLTTRVREIRTEKIRQQLQFAEERFQEVDRELEQAEERLANFLERNQNPNTATLRFRQDRLQQQVNFKEQLYSELQNQVTQTRFNLQRQQPVVTVVEQPFPPMNRSAPQRTFIVVLMTIVGSIIGVIGAFVQTYFQTAEETETEKEKLEEIKENVAPPEWLSRQLLRSKEKKE